MKINSLLRRHTASGYWFFLLLFALSAPFTFATGLSKADSLKNIIASGKQDIQQADAYNVLAEDCFSNYPDSARKLTESSLKLSRQLNYAKGTGEALHLQGRIFYTRGDYDSAEYRYRQAIPYFKDHNLAEQLAGAYRNHSVIYREKGDLDSSRKILNLAIHIFDSLKSNSGLANCYHSLGYIFNDLALYDSSLKYFYDALRFAEKTDDLKLNGKSYNGIGNVFYYLKEYSKALDYYLKADSCYTIAGMSGKMTDNLALVYGYLGNTAKALEYYNQAIETAKRIGDKPSLCRNYLNVGLLYLKVKEFDKGNKSLTEALKISVDLKNPGTTASIYMGLAKVEADRNRPAESVNYLLQAEEYAKRGNSLELLESFYEGIHEQYEKLKDYKTAHEYFLKHIALKDSIMNIEKRKEYKKIETKYETEKKDNQIALLNKNKEIQDAEIKRQTLIRNSILGGVGVIGLFSFLLVRSYARRRKIAFDSQVSHVEMKALRAQMNPHFIFNSLQSIKKYMLENEKNIAAEYLSKFSSLMRLILENSREQEVPLEKDLNALELYMELEALRFENRFQYQIEIDPAINKEDTLIPPMILQPFVENSIIHGVTSKANGLIKIKIAKEGEMIRCSVEDNGIGREQSVKLESTEEKKHESLAMKITQERLNIISRLKKVKAAMNIFDLKDSDNRPGGLRVELLLPYETAF